MNYAIETGQRRCARSGRELRPGEMYFGVLFDRGGNLERRDFSVEGWQGAPPDAFSFWQGRVPKDAVKPGAIVDDSLLLECFDRLTAEDDPGKVNFRYVLGLLLMRRKRLRFEETQRDGDREFLVLRDPKIKKVFRLVNPHLTEEQMAEVRYEVTTVLGL